MQYLSENAFAEFSMPGQLKPCGAKLAFLLRKANLAENRYDHTLHLLEDGLIRPLEAAGRVAAFWWKDPNTLIFARQPEGEGEKPDGMVLYSLSLAAPGAIGEFVHLEQEAEDLAFLPDGRLLYLAPRQDAPLPLGGQECDRDDYEVVTELPFWENGGSFTTGRHRGLWLCENGKARCLTPPATDIEEFHLADGGRRALFFGHSWGPLLPLSSELYELDTQSGEISALPLPAEVFTLQTIAPLDDGRLLLFGCDAKAYGVNQNGAFYLHTQGSAEYRLLYGGGQHTAVSTVCCDVQFTTPCRLCQRGTKALFISTLGGDAKLQSIDLASGQISTENDAPGNVSEFTLLQGDAVFVALRGLAGPELYQSLPGGGEKRLSGWNQNIAAANSCPVPEELWAESPDKTGVQGWLLRPAGWQAGKKYAAVLYIHGGPKAAWGSIFHHELQYLAGQGFAVLFCNPRGSDGRGDDFADIRGRYGSVDAADLLAFLDAALEKHPWLDAEKLGVVGGSYGGFMVNWLIGHSRRFQAAVSQRGIANWMSMAALSDIGSLFVPDQATNPWQNPEAAFTNSPLKYAGEVQTPTLFLHSDKDYRCPLPEGMQMYAALMQRGVPTRLCIFKGENHELSRSGKPRHRVARLREIAGWLEKWLH